MLLNPLIPQAPSASAPNAGVLQHTRTATEQWRWRTYLWSYQQRLQRLFQRLDRDGDQRLERSEVEGHPYLERHFERLDQQKRGYLSPADLRPPAGAAGANARAQRFLTRADRNGDNQLDRQEAEPFPWLQRLFDEIDRNDDGRISGDELRQLRGNGGSSRPDAR